MTDRLAAPWHERHKGKIIAWGLLIGLIGASGVIFRADIRAGLAVGFHWTGSVLGGGWAWLWAGHRCPGWLLLLLGAAGLYVGLELLGWLLTKNDPDHPLIPFAITFDNIRWVGRLRNGVVLGDSYPYCPSCDCLIRPQYWNDYMGPGWTTLFKCDDCGRTNQKLPGMPQDAQSVIARRVEAQWRRGEIRTPNPKAKA